MVTYFANGTLGGGLTLDAYSGDILTDHNLWLILAQLEWFYSVGN